MGGRMSPAQAKGLEELLVVDEDSRLTLGEPLRRELQRPGCATSC